MTMLRRALQLLSAACLVAALAALGGGALAADAATKDDTVAMVKKAVAAIKSQGANKAYAEIDDPSGPFVDRELYIRLWARRHGAGAWRRQGADRHQPTERQGSGRQGIREGARGTRQDAAELLADLQIHEPGDENGPAQADVL